jgi:hypothetical protein
MTNHDARTDVVTVPSGKFVTTSRTIGPLGIYVITQCPPSDRDVDTTGGTPSPPPVLPYPNIR